MLSPRPHLRSRCQTCTNIHGSSQHSDTEPERRGHSFRSQSSGGLPRLTQGQQRDGSPSEHLHGLKTLYTADLRGRTETGRLVSSSLAERARIDSPSGPTPLRSPSDSSEGNLCPEYESPRGCGLEGEEIAGRNGHQAHQAMVMGTHTDESYETHIDGRTVAAATTYSAFGSLSHCCQSPHLRRPHACALKTHGQVAYTT